MLLWLIMYLELFAWKLERYFMKYTFQYTDTLLRDRIKIKKTAVVLETKLIEIAIAILFYRKIKFLELSSIGYFYFFADTRKNRWVKHLNGMYKF